MKRTSNAVEFDRDPVGFAVALGFVPPPSFANRDEWTRRQLAARFLEDAGINVNDTTCAACAAHYGDNGVCDEGKPVASPHRAKGAA